MSKENDLLKAQLLIEAADLLDDDSEILNESLKSQKRRVIHGLRKAGMDISKSGTVNLGNGSKAKLDSSYDLVKRPASKEPLMSGGAIVQSNKRIIPGGTAAYEDTYEDMSDGVSPNSSSNSEKKISVDRPLSRLSPMQMKALADHEVGHHVLKHVGSSEGASKTERSSQARYLSKTLPGRITAITQRKKRKDVENDLAELIVSGSSDDSGTTRAKNIEAFEKYEDPKTIHTSVREFEADTFSDNRNPKGKRDEALSRYMQLINADNEKLTKTALENAGKKKSKLKSAISSLAARAATKLTERSQARDIKARKKAQKDKSIDKSIY